MKDSWVHTTKCYELRFHLSLTLFLLTLMFRKNISIFGAWFLAIFCTRDLLAVKIICCSESFVKICLLATILRMNGYWKKRSMNMFSFLKKLYKFNWCTYLAIRELPRSLWILPGIIFSHQIHVIQGYIVKISVLHNVWPAKEIENEG